MHVDVSDWLQKDIKLNTLGIYVHFIFKTKQAVLVFREKKEVVHKLLGSFFGARITKSLNECHSS